MIHTAELQRRVEGAGPHPSESAELAEFIRATQQMADLEAEVWSPAFVSQLPEAPGELLG